MAPVRRVRRVVRKIDPWTVLKVSLVFNAILALASVLGSVIFWSIFVNAGIPEKISEMAELLTLSFNPDGPTLFRITVLLAVMWTVLATGFATLGALLYNMISDVVGGIEVVVLEESLAPTQVVRPAAPKKPRPVRASRKASKSKPKGEPAPQPAPAPSPAPGPPPAAPSPRPTPAPPRETPVPQPVAAPSRRAAVEAVRPAKAEPPAAAVQPPRAAGAAE